MRSSLVLYVASVLYALFFSATVGRAQAPRGYQPQVTVTAPTRLDWVFALANQSPAQPPADWLPGYDSTAQKYELFIPPQLDSRRPAPLVLFISPSASPAGWNQWQAVCKQAGIVFVSPFDAGNNCPMQQRVRIILDALDDVRRRIPIDADRTYIGGFSGGARVACRIAFALPEYFGGVVPCCGAETLRDESWLRRRAVDRLSAALLTGETDFNRAELERFRKPLLADVGVRPRVWTVPGLGHGVPPAATLAEAVQWLDAGVADRRKLATQWPAMRLAADAAPTREAWSAELLKEAKLRLAKPATLYSGLMQLQGITVRWNDLPAAREAGELLAEYDARPARPWEADDLAEQRLFLLAEARGLDAYASGELPQQYVNQRADMIAGALERWRVLLADVPDSPEGKEAAKRIPVLELSAKKEVGN